jgi:N-acetylmuramoyl-L-alanine amidase
MRATRAATLAALIGLAAGSTAGCSRPALSRGDTPVPTAGIVTETNDAAIDPVIIDRPIVFNEERKALTLDYIHAHYDPEALSIEIIPRMIVLHWTAGCSLEGVWNGFNRAAIDPSQEYLYRYGAVNLSSHFIVGRDGTIYRIMPETIMARHVIGLNRIAIGIENVGTDVGCTLTPAQEEANAALVRYLVGKYPTITHLIGHYESDSFRGTPLYEDLMPGYYTPKIDPGPEFMKQVRELVDDLGLSP